MQDKKGNFCVASKTLCDFTNVRIKYSLPAVHANSSHIVYFHRSSGEQARSPENYTRIIGSRGNSCVWVVLTKTGINP